MVLTLKPVKPSKVRHRPWSERVEIGIQTGHAYLLKLRTLPTLEELRKGARKSEKSARKYYSELETIKMADLEGG